MVCLQANEENLFRLLTQYPGTCRGFRDSDLDDMLTAVAFCPVTYEKGQEMFQNFRLA